MQRGLAHPDTGTASRAGARIRPAPAPLASRTMKQASCSSTDQGGGKRRGEGTGGISQPCWGGAGAARWGLSGEDGRGSALPGPAPEYYHESPFRFVGLESAIRA
jgi:hypothetical protein